MERFALTLAAVLALAGQAAAQDGLELSLEVAAPKVEVGGVIKATVHLKNAGSAPVDLPELIEDVQSVSLGLSLDGKSFSHHKITPSPYQPKSDWTPTPLAPGAERTLTVDLPALTTGKLTITARYGRAPRRMVNADGTLIPWESATAEQRNGPISWGFGEPRLTSAPVEVEMTPTAAGNDEVRVRMVTSMGPIELRLFPHQALGTALHFARLIRDGRRQVGDGQEVPFYEGLTFHRVINGFMIQGGCPEGNGLGDPGYAIPAELAPKPIPEGLKHLPGRLSMARSSGHVDSAGSQFFICVGPAPSIDGNYTCFGEVTRGMDVVYAIAEVETSEGNKPIEPVTIDSISLRTAKAKR